MKNETIEDIALKNGFKLKQQPSGEMALNPYVFDFAKALLGRGLHVPNLWGRDSYLSEYPEILSRKNDSDCSNDILFFTKDGQVFVGWYVSMEKDFCCGQCFGTCECDLDPEYESKFVSNYGDEVFEDDDVIYWVYLIDENGNQQYSLDKD